MPELNWHEAVDLIEPYIVKISTPEGSGTGFLFARSVNTLFCAVATAAHVVNQAHSWQQPIRISHHASGQIAFLKEEDRAIFVEDRLDTAAIIFRKDMLPLPEKLLPLSTKGSYLKRGIELGWIGFPAVSHNNLCFFSGSVSVYLQPEEAYLIDGVAINGVSGGPAFLPDEDGGITLAGVISAYIPNRATGESLPGLSMASDVSQLQAIVSSLASLDEAKRKESSSKSDAPTANLPSASGA